MSGFADDFSDFGGVAYLNCAYHGALPRVAAAATCDALRLKQTPYLVRDEHHFDFPDAYRAAAARLIGAAPEDVAVTNSATDGIMLVAGGLDWRDGDEVVLPRGEFPANLFPWRAAAARGVVVKEVDIARGAESVARVEAALSPRTRVVAASWVGYSSGLRLDLAGLSRLTRARGVLLVVDGSQGVGGLPLDVRETPCDVLACAGYKWLLGPYGLGFAYVAPGVGERLAARNLNWFSIAGARDFNRLSQCALEFPPGARRFDVNEPASFLNLAGGTASLEYLASVGPERVRAHAQGLLERLVAGLPAGHRVVSEPDPALRSNILCFAAESESATERAFQALRAARVVVSRREGWLRVSPHLYNTADDVERVVETLRAAAKGAGASVAIPALPLGERLGDKGPAQALARASLRGRYVTLSPLDPERDLDDLYTGSHGDPQTESLWTYMGYGPFAGREAMREWLGACAASADPLFLTVSDNASGARVGIATFMAIRPAHRCLELGNIWYLPRAQRTHANTEAAYLMLCEAFDRLGYRRVEWKCDSLNARSRRAALRLGFAFEGIFRQHMVVKGRNRDTAWFALLDADWPRVKRNLETWLYSEGQAALSELNRSA